MYLILILVPLTTFEPVHVKEDTLVCYVIIYNLIFMRHVYLL